MDVTLPQLRTLRELERLGTMAAVAASLGYTHGAISQQLANLEKACGFELTVRSGRRVSLTDAGSVLARHANDVLEQVRVAEQALDDLRGEVAGTVRLGTFGTIAAVLMSMAVRAAAEEYPRINIVSREVDVDDATAAVRRGDVDAAFGLDYPNAPIPREDGIEHIALRSERFGLAVSPRVVSSHSHAPMDLADAAEWNWILPPADTHYGRAVRVGCRSSGFEPRVIHEVTDTAASLSLAASGLGVTPITTMMRAMMSGLDLLVVPLNQVITRQVILARRSGPGARPSVDALVSVLRGVVDRTGGPMAENDASDPSESLHGSPHE